MLIQRAKIHLFFSLVLLLYQKSEFLFVLFFSLNVTNGRKTDKCVTKK